MDSRVLSSSNISQTHDFEHIAPPLTADTVSNHRRFRWRGIVAALVLLPSLVVMLFSTPFVLEGSWIAGAIEVMAWVTFVAGTIFRFWATLYIGGRKENILVTDGPYSICRNPLYLGSFLLALATALFLQSLLCVVAVLIVTLIYMLTTVPVEEEFLRVRHGEEYQAYLDTVPRYWPSVQRFETPANLTIDIHRLRLECARASRWVWLPLLGVLLPYLRAQPWWPILFQVF